MANYTFRTESTTKSLQYTRAEAPGTGVCSVCGGLECLCRPRFFAGQLLTEQDLNRLDHYITAKSKLQNRHLHGWGVACGLEVLCNPCDNQIKVTAGYALSPCGDDIVVCEDEVVDICKLIKICRDKERQQQECEPPTYSTQDECEDEEDWLLTIRYEEQPTRGITALRNSGAAACCKKCNCGGSASCTCTCHTSSGAVNSSYSNSTSYSPECEPSVICEGYRFEVYRDPGTGLDQGKIGTGAMAQRFNQCVNPFLQFFYEWFGDALADYQEKSMNELYTLCCSLKSALRELFKNHATHNCTLREKIECIVCPQPDPQVFPTPEDYVAVFEDQLDDIIIIWVNGVWDCMCSMMLPPCPDDEDPRIVLARVTVSKSDCKVLRVCNWITQRKFLTTFPNLQYWLSWMPYMRYLRYYMELLCCNLIQLLDTSEPASAAAGYRAANVDTTGATTTKVSKSRIKFDTLISPQINTKSSKDFSKLAMQMISGDMKGLDARTLFLGNLGLSDEDGQEYMTSLQKENLLPFLLINQLGRTTLKNVMPDGSGEHQGLFSTLLSGFQEAAAEAKPAEKDEVATLKQEIAELKNALKKQDEQINKLSKRVEKGK